MCYGTVERQRVELQTRAAAALNALRVRTTLSSALDDRSDHGASTARTLRHAVRGVHLMGCPSMESYILGVHGQSRFARDHSRACSAVSSEALGRVTQQRSDRPTTALPSDKQVSNKI